MNGRFLLDTNAVIELLKGKIAVVEMVHSAKWVGISIITQLEFLSFSNLTHNDEILFNAFVGRVNIVSLSVSDTRLLKHTLSFRKQYNVKLPDAIISACAIPNSASLVTNDAGLSKVSELEIINF